MTSNDGSNNVQELLDSLNFADEQLRKFASNLKKSPKARLTKSHLLSKQKDAEKVWDIYQLAYKSLWSANTRDATLNISYFKSQSYEECTILHEDIETFLLDHLEPFNVPIIHSDNQSSNQQLPVVNQNLILPPKDPLKRIDIPIFNGDFKSWTTFHDLFQSMIHNNTNYSNVQKLLQLRSRVSGEAAELLSNFQITDANYADAWNLLLKVYNNKRALIDSQLEILLNIKPIFSESSHLIRKLLFSIEQCIKSLKNIDNTVQVWDYFIIFINVRKLPSETRKLWEQSLTSRDVLPTYEEFEKFLENRYRALEAINPITSFTPNPIIKKQANKTLNSFNKQNVCSLCSKEHHIRSCPQFLLYDLERRNSTIRNLKLCLNCLNRDHSVLNCPSKGTCFHCKQRHHTTIHKPLFVNNPHNNLTSSNNQSTFSNKTLPTSGNPLQNLHSTVSSINDTKIFATALVKTYSSQGEPIILRALLDPASEACFITKAAVQILKIKESNVKASVAGLGSIILGNTTGKVNLKFTSIHNEDTVFNIEAFTFPTVSNAQPSKYIHGTNEWKYLEHLNLADPLFYIPNKIDLLLDLGVFSTIIGQGFLKSPVNSGLPNIHETKLGWIVLGTFSQQVVSKIHTNNTNYSISSIPQREQSSTLKQPVKILLSNIQLDKQITKFWEQEELLNSNAFTNEESLCESFYQKTVQRQKDGRYIVSLPLHHKFGYQTALGRSKHKALSRYKRLETSFLKSPQLFKTYSKNINEYFDLDQIEEVKTSEDYHITMNEYGPTYSCYYLPHHGVTKCSKFRIVFDASCKTSNGQSLNDIMLNGPKIQNDLSTIINNWRKHRYVFQADIEKMYRQIKVTSEDSDYQRILWRNSFLEPIKEYKLTTVPFGLKASPFLAIRTLHQVAQDEKHKYSLASKSLIEDFYIDDLKSGSCTINEALELQQQLIQLTESAHFPLRKWVANSSELIERIPVEHRQQIGQLQTIVNDEVIKSLGIFWNPSADFFTFRLNSTIHNEMFTKRSLLSEISKLYDPLGWISPVIVKAKILMQNLWTIDCGWDQIIPTNFTQRWTEIQGTLDCLESVKIPRWIGSLDSLDNIQLHGFCDASQAAYSAVVYIRTSHKSQVSISLLASKTRVSPLKTLTIPKLELCAAVLLSKFVKHIQFTMKFQEVSTFLWTDSTIVLNWIKQSSVKQETFVVNRVATIRANAHSTFFRHVVSTDNPADCASRGIFPQELLKNSLWWYGPKWLSQGEQFWPQHQTINEISDETKPIYTLTTKLQPQLKPSFELFTKFSSFRRMIRVTAYCQRFIQNCQQKHQSSYLTTKELDNATTTIIKSYQEVEFPKEIAFLRNQESQPIDNRKIPTFTQALLKLNPFIDDKGLLRVGGRLKHSQLPYNRKYPIILNNLSFLTKLIIKDAHILTLHGGAQLVLNYLRTKFWILGGRNTIQTELRECLWCNRVEAKLQSQLMGDLPDYRIQPTIRAFVQTGVDYAGPVTLRDSHLRKAKFFKGYIVVFVCLTTRAIHIEAVSDATSQSFLKAFYRFSSRRALPHTMYSDNSKTFVGADRILQDSLNKALITIHSELAEELANQGINWSFIPPYSPNFGGIWESGVKTVKRLLYRTIVNTVLTFEELSTYLTQIEACVNSRPLCPMSDDPNDLEVLTPGHFLIGDSLLAHPEPDLSNLQDFRLERWRLIQKRMHEFWRRWSKEYLVTLQQRNKWVTPHPCLKAGDLVLLKEDFIPCRKWLRGRVITTYPGKDSLVRVVDVRTATGSIFRKNVRDLALLLNPTGQSE